MMEYRPRGDHAGHIGVGEIGSDEVGVHCSDTAQDCPPQARAGKARPTEVQRLGKFVALCAEVEPRQVQAREVPLPVRQALDHLFCRETRFGHGAPFLRLP